MTSSSGWLSSNFDGAIPFFLPFLALFLDQLELRQPAVDVAQLGLDAFGRLFRLQIPQSFELVDLHLLDRAEHLQVGLVERFLLQLRGVQLGADHRQLGLDQLDPLRAAGDRGFRDRPDRFDVDRVVGDARYPLEVFVPDRPVPGFAIDDEIFRRILGFVHFRKIDAHFRVGVVVAPSGIDAAIEIPGILPARVRVRLSGGVEFAVQVGEALPPVVRRAFCLRVP